jgi:hypothetical protein
MNLSDLISPLKRPPAIDSDASQDTDAKSVLSPALAKQQQAFLAEIRSSLSRDIPSHRAQEKRIKERFALLLNHTQWGSWESIWPFLDAISKFDFSTATGAIVLGGWHRKPDCPKPPCSSLIEDMFALGIYSSMRERIDAIYRVTQAEKDSSVAAVWALAREYSPAFDDAVSDDSWSIGSLRKVAEKSISSLVPKIHEHLLFMQEDALIFYPSPADPSGGWRDFWLFVRGYNFLPGSIKNSFGSYFLLLQIPSSK